MADERIDIEVQDKVAPGIRDKILGIADAADKADNGVEKLKKALAGLNDSAINKLNQAVNANATAILKQAQAQNQMQTAANNAALASQKLATEQQKTATAAAQAAAAQTRATTAQTQGATAAQRLATAQAQTATAQQRSATEAQRTATAAAQAAAAQDRAALAALRLKQAQEQAANSSKGLSSELATLGRQAVALAGTYFGAKAVLDAADAYTNLQNKLRNVTDTSIQLNEVSRQVFDIANRTRSPVAETAAAFQRFDMAMKQLGASQQESLRMTETINKAIVVSGATSQEAAAGMLQLAQAFGSGRLQGDEFRSIMENLPAVADMIAKHLGVTRGELKKMSTDGKLTAQVMREAFAAAAADMDARFGKTVPTIGQSMTVLKNNFTQFVGQVDQSLGVTRAISTIILTLANNMGVLAAALATVGAAFLVVYGPTLLNMLSTASKAVWAFNLALAANPIGAVIVAITAVIALLAIFKDSIKLGTDETTTLGDVMRAVWSYIVEGATAAYNMLVRFGTWLQGVFAPIWDWLKSVTGGFFDNIDLSLAGLIRLWAKAWDTIIGVVVGTVKALIAAWQAFPKAFGDLILTAVNAGIGLFENFVNAAIGLLNKLIGAMNMIGSNDLTKALGIDVKLLNELDTVNIPRLTNNFAGGMREAGGNVAQAFADGFNSSHAITDGVNAVFDRASEINKKRLAQQAADARAAADSLRPSGPAAAVTSDSDDKAAKAAQKRADALAKVNRELDAEIKNMGLLKPEREIQSRMSQIENELANKHIQLSQQERAELLAKIQKIQELKEVQTQLDAIYEQMIQPMTTYNATLAAANQLMQQGIITAAQYSQVMIDARTKLLESQNTVAAGLELGFLKIAKDVNNVSGTIANTMTSAFSKVEDALVKFVTTGKLDFKELANSIIADIARMVIKLLILRPLMNGLGGMFGIPGFSTGGSFDVPGFATGGQFMVNSGSQVGDRNLVAFRANGGERVTVETKDQQRRNDQGRVVAGNVSVNVYTQDANSFVQSEGQVAAAAARAIQRGYRNL